MSTNFDHSYKLHGSARPMSMKSDVIRKRARHDARRANGNSSEIPYVSPGASRCASPEGSTPTLAPDSTIQSSYSSEESEHRGHGPTQSDVMNPLATMSQSQQNGVNSNNSNGFSSHLSYTLTSSPPSSANSYGSYNESYPSAASSTSHSQRSSLDFSFSFPSYGLSRDQHNSSLWHPPMLPPDNSSQFVHPPMLSPEELPMDMDYLPDTQHNCTNTLFNTYLHLPMLLPEHFPQVSMGLLLLHPPMVPHGWGAIYKLYDNTAQVY